MVDSATTMMLLLVKDNPREMIKIHGFVIWNCSTVDPQLSGSLLTH